ncbi:MAG: methylmalonyl-CoA mutase, N-terminal domain/subunit [Bacteroidetes bacterium]|nr:methylmalonyl-CoA mutase, N-terminal domain/subunit [Bacteroidota bacterium]
MEEKRKLFEEFPPVSAEQWIQQVVKDLKGENFDEKLKYTTADGIRVNPFYTLEDLTKYNERRPLFSHADWDVCEEITVISEKEANKQALNALNNGASALVLHISSTVNLQVLLNEIKIEYIAVQFVVKADAVAFANVLNSYLTSQNIDAAHLNLSINADGIAALLKTGNWEGIEAEIKKVIGLFSDKNSFRTININSYVYQNAGAPQGYEIGCALAHANEYLSRLLDTGVKPGALKNKIQLNVAVGPDYFFEIAKLRAYRKVMALLFEEYKIDSEIYIHAETSFRNLTVFDAHNNLLRATTEAMAATIGGCNSLSVKAFDAAYTDANPFSDRLSRNIQLILKSESYFDKIADAAAGTYFIEELTEQLAQKAWTYFTEIEKNGGLISCIEKGNIQSTIKAFAAKEQADFDAGKEVLIGTNKFPNLKEDKKSVADSVVWGNEEAKGKTVEPLDESRLSVKNEKERLVQSSKV